MQIRRKIGTAMLLLRVHGIQGLLYGTYNKIRGRELTYGFAQSMPSPTLIERKIRTAILLLRVHGIRGLLHGIYNKIRGRELTYGFDQSIPTPISVLAPSPSPTLFEVCQCLVSELPQTYGDQHGTCTVIIPVYNGLEHLKRLLPSVEKNTPTHIEVLLLNDASTDSQIVPFIRTFLKDNSNWRLLENDQNCGFVKTVNRGMKNVHTDYAILLNTDTMVPQNWIPKMLNPFAENEKIATTTPFTNSGVYFSFPHFGVDNEPKRDLDKLNHAFSYVVSNEYARNEIFSGTGFCMAINMKCWREIGELDYENFGKGYGEENDWCFRAKQKGWRHLLVPNLFVHHFHGGSFESEEKKRYMAEHQKILREKYSHILSREIPNFAAQDPWKVYRFAAAVKFCASNTVLYVDLKAERSDVSGAVDYAQKELDLLGAKNYSIIIAQYTRLTKQWSIVPYTLDPSIEIPMEDIMDLQFLFDVTDIKEVVINNLAFCENADKAAMVFTKLRTQYEFTMSYKFHDYLSVCPNFFLINKDTKPCNPAIIDINSNYCKDCLRQSCRKAVQRDYLVPWRTVFSAFFEKVDSCYFFSNYTKNIVCKLYPQLIPKAMVKYHEPLLSTGANTYERPQYEGKWNISFVGNFCTEKGAEYFVGMKNKIDQLGDDAQFVIIGENNYRPLLNKIKVLGRYKREELGQLLTENKIHIVLYPSINNETFSYVAQELMLLNVPMVVFPCGAPQERIKAENYQLGRVAEGVDLESLFNATNELLYDVYGEKLT